MGLIEKEALLEYGRTHKLQEIFPDWSHLSCEAKQAVIRLAKAWKGIVDDAPTVEQPRWIPVKERLPELKPCSAGTAYSEAVIVWTAGKKMMVAVWDGIDFMCAADYWDAEGDEILYWMDGLSLLALLPEPPTPEECSAVEPWSKTRRRSDHGD